jgi:hypothetical protein
MGDEPEGLGGNSLVLLVSLCRALNHRVPRVRRAPIIIRQRVAVGPSGDIHVGIPSLADTAGSGTRSSLLPERALEYLPLSIYRYEYLY